MEMSRRFGQALPWLIPLAICLAVGGWRVIEGKPIGKWARYLTLVFALMALAQAL